MKSNLPKHHAIFAEGDAASTLDFFRQELKKRGIEPVGNPDVTFIHHDSLGIDEARELVKMSVNAPVAQSKRIIVLSFDSITLQAQNALLKLFEDPSISSEFLVASNNANVLLQTLRSRFFVMSRRDGNAKTGKKFVSLQPKEKIMIMDKMLKEYKESGDKAPIRAFLENVYFELEKNPKENAAALRAAAQALSYINTPSASMKLLLEGVILNTL